MLQSCSSYEYVAHLCPLCVTVFVVCVSGSRSYQQVVNVVGVVNISVAFDSLCMCTTIGMKAELYLNLNPCTIGWVLMTTQSQV